MKCKDTCAMLSDYLDGELNDEILTEMDEHLLQCSICARKLDQLEKSLRILKRLDEKKAPHTFLRF